MLSTALANSSNEEDHALLDDEYRIVCEYNNDFQIDEE